MNIDRTRYLTMVEAAKEFDYSYDHIRRLVKSGAIATFDISERIRLIDKTDLLRYLSEKPQRKPHKKE